VQANFGDTTPGNFLDPGTYTMSGTGGRDVGAFTATTNVPTVPFVWTNPPAAMDPFDRSQDYTAKWTGGIPGTQFVIAGASGTGAFLCAAPIEDGQFTVPAWVFLSLPVTGTIPGGLSVINGSLGTFTATGLDIATIRYTSGANVSMKYQ
jgi:hypothetical protein